ncbi:MAG: hypothetical protein CSB33_01985 [Desulfobacterales bacterium]|nr:MAG: hypothetical protein CSB33_01985 [Desulfobacterales bacterium]
MRDKIKMAVMLIIMAGLAGCAGISASDGPKRDPAGKAASDKLASAGPVGLLTALYQGPLNHLEAVRHGSCPMHPTCSQYAVEVLKSHNELTAWFLICDRLMRCGRDEIRLAPVIQMPDGLRALDPPPRP